MPMKNPPHPGLSVRHDCLEPLGLSVTEAARKLGVSRKQLSDIVNCRAGISPEMAIRLDKAFGGGAETWYRLQSSWGVGPGAQEGGSDQGRASLACRVTLAGAAPEIREALPRQTRPSAPSDTEVLVHDRLVGELVGRDGGDDGALLHDEHPLRQRLDEAEVLLHQQHREVERRGKLGELRPGSGRRSRAGCPRWARPAARGAGGRRGSGRAPGSAAPRPRARAPAAPAAPPAAGSTPAAPARRSGRGARSRPCAGCP